MFGSNKTLTGIISSFTKNIEDLRELANKNETEAALCEEVAEELTIKAGGLKQEASRASGIADKINQLIS